MSDDSPRDAGTDDASDQWIDSIADRFEVAWRENERPELEDFLAEVAQSRREALLRELVQLDVQYRQRNGESPAAEDYLPRFPELGQPWLEEVIAKDLADDAAGKEGTPEPAPADANLRAAVRVVRCPHCHNPMRLIEQRLEEMICPGCGSSFSLCDSDMTTTLQRSRKVGKFQLFELIGRGAFGEVWRAKDESLDRIVALKIPHGGRLASEIDRERFQREARVAAQLRHPGVVTIYEVADLNGIPAIVSEFVQGVPLQDLLDVRLLPFTETAELVAGVADALDYAHNMGAIHRDIKPSNIMVERRGLREIGNRLADDRRDELPPVGRPKIMDFGLALREEAEITLTIDGQILGTPAYMSPEQAAGKGHQVDGRSDIYSLGAVLYQMLTGQLPFRGSKLMLVEQVLYEEPRPPRKINDRIPRDLETICLKSMAKNPGRRYETARDMGDDLRRWLRDEPILARPVGHAERFWRWIRRNPRVALLSSAVFLLLIAVTIISTTAGLRIAKEKANVEQEQQQAEHQRQLAVDALVDALILAKPDAVPQLLERLTELKSYAAPRLRERFEDPQSAHEERLRAACGLAALGDVRTSYLIGAIPTSPATECQNIANALDYVRDQASASITELLDNVDDVEAAIRYRVVLGCLDNLTMVRALLSLDNDRSTRTKFIHTLGAWWHNWSVLPRFLRETSDSGYRSAMCAGLGLIDPATLPAADRQALQETLIELYCTAPDGGTHSAADWALRRWKVEQPSLVRSSGPEEGKQWFVSPSGVTMVRIPDGEYAAVTPAVPGFFLGDREIPISLFAEFINDPACPDAEKPIGWQNWRPAVTDGDKDTNADVWGPLKSRSPSNACPIVDVCVIDAIHFCNWLSKREGRQPCYSPSTHEWLISVGDGSRQQLFAGWDCDFSRNGFRLPTLWEWRYAAAAGSFPHHFGSISSTASLLKLHVDFTGIFPASFENEGVLLERYAWFSLNSQKRSWPGGLLLPSPWGLFDTFGNANELTWSRHMEGGWFDICGGDWVGDQSYCSLTTIYSANPWSRGARYGFRVACSDPTATAAFEQLLAEREQRVKKEPLSRSYAEGLVGTYAEQADRLRDAGQFETALEWYEKGATVLREFEAALAAAPEPKQAAGPALTGQRINEFFGKHANMLESLERPDEAFESWLVVLQSGGKSPDRMRKVLEQALELARAGEHARAIKAVPLVQPHASPKGADLWLLAAKVAGQSAACLAPEESAQRSQEEEELRQQYLELAIQCARTAIEDGLQDLTPLQQDPAFQPLQDDARFRQLWKKQPTPPPTSESGV